MYLASLLEAASSPPYVSVIEATARDSIRLRPQSEKCLSSRRPALVGFGVTMDCSRGCAAGYYGQKPGYSRAVAWSNLF